jgi:Family of unknown function (DUF6221)
VRAGDWPEAALIAFLTARYAEDWTAARDREMAAGLDESRATRDVDTKREILDLYVSTLALVQKPLVLTEGPYAGKINARDYEQALRELAVLRPVILAQASVYSDHADYDPGRKP